MAPGNVILAPKKTPMISDWMFCPICGTPRPKEKSLVDKFMEEWGRYILNPDSQMKLFDRFEKIAEEHYVSSK